MDSKSSTEPEELIKDNKKNGSIPSVPKYESSQKDDTVENVQKNDFGTNENRDENEYENEKQPSSSDTHHTKKTLSDDTRHLSSPKKASTKPPSENYKFPHVPSIPPINFPPKDPKTPPLVDFAAGSPPSPDRKTTSSPHPCSKHHSAASLPSLLPPTELLCERCSHTMLSYLSTLRSVMDNIMLDIVVKSIDKSSSQCPECLKEELKKSEPEIKQEVLQQLFQKPSSETKAQPGKRSSTPKSPGHPSKKGSPPRGHPRHHHKGERPEHGSPSSARHGRREDSRIPSSPGHRSIPSESVPSEYHPHIRFPERTKPFTSKPVGQAQPSPENMSLGSRQGAKHSDERVPKDHSGSSPSETIDHGTHHIKKEGPKSKEEGSHPHIEDTPKDSTTICDSPKSDAPRKESSPHIGRIDDTTDVKEEASVEERRPYDTGKSIEETSPAPAQPLIPPRRISWSAPPQKKSPERRISWSGTPRNFEKEAFVTVVSTNAQALGALILGHSLKLVGISRRLFALLAEDVSPHLSHLLSTVWDDVMTAGSLGSSETKRVALLGDLELGATFEKLHVWRLEGRFDKCVFLDPDTLVVQKCEELFDREELSAVPDIGWPDCFHPGVFVCRPSRQTFLGLVELAASQGSYDGGEQHVLNMYFRNWRMDISKKLPFIYNLMASVTYTYTPAFKKFGSDVKIVNFIGNYKPWNVAVHKDTGLLSPSANIHPSYVHFVRYWLEIFLKRVLPLLPRECQEYAAGQSYLTPKDVLREIDISLDQDGGQVLPTALSIRLRVPRIVAVPPAPSPAASFRSRQHVKPPESAAPQAHPVSPESGARPAQPSIKGEVETSAAESLKAGIEETLHKGDTEEAAKKGEAEEVVVDPYQSMQAWEQGRMDYLGQDRSDNILKRLDFLIHDTAGK